VIYFGTLAQREATSRGALRALLAATPAMRFLDLNVREGQVTERCVFESLHEADVVKVNEQELSELFRWYTHTLPPTTDMAASEVQLACSRLMRVFGVSGLIVTLGPRGVVYFGADGTRHGASVQADAGALVDTVGAGDAFSAIFLLGSTRAWPLATTLQRANDFAAAICALAGAVPADIAFYEQWHTRWLAD
jgi:sugar/nucleoside kinase (ribokinase family)